MARTTPGLGVTFVRAPDGLLLVLESPKWKLERGKAYSVQLVAGPRSTEAKAVAELKGVTIALADRSFNEILRAANFLDVRGEGATLRVPLDKSTLPLIGWSCVLRKMDAKARRRIHSLRPPESLK